MMEPNEKRQDRYLTVGRVAEILVCTERHVYEMVKEGKLKALRLGIRAIRISELSLTEFIEKNKVDPDEYFGFENLRDSDPNPVHSKKVIGQALMEK